MSNRDFGHVVEKTVWDFFAKAGALAGIGRIGARSWVSRTEPFAPYDLSFESTTGATRGEIKGSRGGSDSTFLLTRGELASMLDAPTWLFRFSAWPAPKLRYAPALMLSDDIESYEADEDIYRADGRIAAREAWFGPWFDAQATTEGQPMRFTQDDGDEMEIEGEVIGGHPPGATQCADLLYLNSQPSGEPIAIVPWRFREGRYALETRCRTLPPEALTRYAKRSRLRIRCFPFPARGAFSGCRVFSAVKITQN